MNRQHKLFVVTAIVLALTFFVSSVWFVCGPWSSDPLAAPVVSQLDNTEVAMTPLQEEAVKSAKSYLDGNGFSKQYLTDWMISYEKFSKEDVEFALDYLKPNWNEQAVLTGQTYLSGGTGMTREGLIEQMSNPNGDKYTKAQATFAADHLLPR